MIKVTVIGSGIVCKIAQLLPKDKYKIEDEYISINPLSFVKDKPGIDLKLPRVNRESYDDDLKNNVFDKISNSNSDIIIIDLLDCRLNVNNYLFGDVTVTATENNGLNDAIKNYDLKLENIISPFDINEEEWFDVFQKYKSRLLKSAPDKKIIIVDVRCAVTYLSKCKKIYNLFSIEYSSKLYNFFSKMYCIMRLAAPNFTYLPGLDVYFCDESENGKVFSCSLQKEFYEYASKAIDKLWEGANIEDIYKLRNEVNTISLNRYKQSDLREKSWKNVELRDFCGIYVDDYGNYIDTSNNKINLKLNGQNNKLLIHKDCCVSGCNFELGNNNIITIGEGTFFRGNTVIRIGNDNKIEIGCQCVFDALSFTIKNRNEINLGNRNKLINSCSLGIDSNCKLNFADNNDIWKMEVHLFNNSSFIVGNNNFFNKSILITCHSYTNTHVHDFSIFASEVEIINGDGHSIFDNSTKRKVNDMSIGNNTIEICDHVWLCRRAMLLSGAKIGQGCIVGAGAIVNKSYSLNNCLIAGVPAQIKKKNISWCRNNDTSDMEDCAPFNQTTVENEEEN